MLYWDATIVLLEGVGLPKTCAKVLPISGAVRYTGGILSNDNNKSHEHLGRDTWVKRSWVKLLISRCCPDFRISSKTEIFHMKLFLNFFDSWFWGGWVEKS